MTSNPRMLSAWAAILGVAALALASVHHPAELTEASWTDSEYAAAELRYEAPEPEETEEPPESDAPTEPEDPSEAEDPADPSEPEDPRDPEDPDSSPNPEDPDEGEPETPDVPIADGGAEVDQARVDEINTLPALQPKNDLAAMGLTFQTTSVTPLGGRTLDFCHDSTISNSSEEPVEWELEFDTSQAPLWGWTPYATSGEPRFQTQGNPRQGAFTGDFDTTSSIWSIRGQDFRSDARQSWLGDTRTIEPGADMALRFCTLRDSVPYPEVDTALFTWDLSNDGGWSLGISADVQTPVETYIPWAITIDLSQIVCPEFLDDATLRWQGGEVTALDDSGHRFSYRLSQNDEFDLIRADAPVQRGIVRVQLPGRSAGANLQPNC
ncbi:hypothetical protein LTI14_12605 [Nesterenkonia sp. YGD6]|uniref:hypothetical protein n=1 Tax=Nesterenkonia sp. YGD6 TaxID=2901231 RepID=UPI001F4C5850|nr:hypothetical protein [Nesterenkonia sp. YGD6]MCH8564050.1 hypothetical protein [Nesterenkonia sp. YGD6]